VNDEIYLVLAAYNEGQSLAAVVSELAVTYPNIIVVDDGSSDDTAAEGVRGGATVLRHVVNRGQGAALQTGIAYALQQGATYIVTFDSDGQHQPADVAALVAPIAAGRAEIVLGSRFLGTTERMPRIRRLLLHAAILFTRVASGARVTDTHNGLRALSRRAAAMLDIRLDRMAHASEIIDQVVRSGLPYEEVPVHIRYTDYSRAKGQSSLGALRVLVDYLWGRWLR
jgi:glycosyltransferase involved in cell wall biosynthesis